MNREVKWLITYLLEGTMEYEEKRNVTFRRGANGWAQQYFGFQPREEE